MSIETVERIRRSGPQERGEEPRVERALRRNEIADHEAHRLTDRPSTREAARRVLEQRGAAEEAEHEAGHGVLRAEPSRHRTVVLDEVRARLVAEDAIDRLGGELCRRDRAVNALARERVEEPGGIADEEPARAGSIRDGVTERRDPGHAVQRLCATERSVLLRGELSKDAASDLACSQPPQAREPRSPE